MQPDGRSVGTPGLSAIVGIGGRRKTADRVAGRGVEVAMSWYVLAHDAQYFGLIWELFNGSPRRPRSGLVDLQHAQLSCSLGAARVEARRARGILGLEFQPVPIRFEGRGPETRILRAD